MYIIADAVVMTAASSGAGDGSTCGDAIRLNYHSDICDCP